MTILRYQSREDASSECLFSGDSDVESSQQVRYKGASATPTHFCPPPPFFRGSAVLVLVLACAGCTGPDGSLAYSEVCERGIFPGMLPLWFDLFLQSFIVGFTVASIVSIILYRIQLGRLRGRDITSYVNKPPSLPFFAIPAVCLILVVSPLLFALLFLGEDCFYVYKWSIIVGMWVGGFSGWALVFQAYFQSGIKKIRRIP